MRYNNQKVSYAPESEVYNPSKLSQMKLLLSLIKEKEVFYYENLNTVVYKGSAEDKEIYKSYHNLVDSGRDYFIFKTIVLNSIAIQTFQYSQY